MSWQKSPQNKNSPNKVLLRYAGLTMQILVMLSLALLAGYYIDKWLNIFPVFTCLVPIIVLVLFFYRLIRETSRRKENRNL